ncbi:hypothetical protein [Streptomyces noursei]|uniref:hypothetical protein n=1 Tax=Streptomyces noursei TaxID=1971 RepID=UPI00380410C7
MAIDPTLQSGRGKVEKASAMRCILPVLFLAAAVLLAGCDFGIDTRPKGPPTATTTASQTDTELADRYHKAGGKTDVYGIESAKNDQGVLVLSVWTHRNTRYENVDNFAANLVSFLTREGVRLDRGYVLNVYGADGTRLHNLDTTPERNP